MLPFQGAKWYFIHSVGRLPYAGLLKAFSLLQGASNIIYGRILTECLCGLIHLLASLNFVSTDSYFHPAMTNQTFRLLSFFDSVFSGFLEGQAQIQGR